MTRAAIIKIASGLLLLSLFVFYAAESHQFGQYVNRYYPCSLSPEDFIHYEPVTPEQVLDQPPCWLPYDVVAMKASVLTAFLGIAALILATVASMKSKRKA